MDNGLVVMLKGVSCGRDEALHSVTLYIISKLASPNPQQGEPV